MNIGTHGSCGCSVRHIDQIVTIGVLDHVGILLNALGTALTHNERHGSRRRSCLCGVAVNREEQTCVGLVCDVDTCLQIARFVSAPMLIRGAGVDHIHLGYILLDHTSHFECHAEGDVALAVLLAIEHADRTGVVSTVSGVDNDGHRLIILCESAGHTQQSGGQNR